MRRICTFRIVLATMSLVLMPQLQTPAVAENRSFDGIGNSIQNQEWGAASTVYRRVAPASYGDGISSPAGSDRPGARVVSNAVGDQREPVPNERRLSGFVYAFGQFINHDIELTRIGGELFPIRAPSDDRYFRGQTLAFNRSRFDQDTGTGPENPRQQINWNTSYIDASNIYGSDQRRADALREDMNGELGAKLATGSNNLLPRNTNVRVEMDNGGFQASANMFSAGDIRANENLGLANLHTLFMREHNRLVDEVTAAHPAWSQEQLYQRARKIVGAEMQAIIYQEFLPALLGPYAPAGTGDYDQSVDASVLNEFAAVFLRVGHSMLAPSFRRIQNDGTPERRDPVRLGQTEFNVVPLLRSDEDLAFHLKGFSIEPQAEVDMMIDDGLRNVVAAGIDLFAIDIQRGRDHGLADYNTMRRAFGLPAVTSFAEITSDSDRQTALEQLFGDVNSVDPIIGVLAEDHLPDSSLGPLASAGFNEQFTRLRDGDRFWYEHDQEFTSEEIEAIRTTRLSDIIRRNTQITNLHDNVFFVPDLGDINGSGDLDVGDIDVLTAQVGTAMDRRFDLNNDRLTNDEDRRVWVKDLKKTYVGDANLDGEFNTSDLIVALAAGTYEADVDAGWASGDFDGSGRFDSGDLIDALADGGYEAGLRPAAVPESSSFIVFALALGSLTMCRKPVRRQFDF